jgi:hypothetical protein
MSNRFTYDSQVRVVKNAPSEMRPGQKAWVIAVLRDKSVPKYRRFNSDVVYTIEFEDGSSIDIEGDLLEIFAE